MNREEFFLFAYHNVTYIQTMLVNVDQGLKHHSTNMEAINEFVDDMTLINSIMRKWTKTFIYNHNEEHKKD